jgi:hypothetical protein
MINEDRLMEMPDFRGVKQLMRRIVPQFPASDDVVGPLTPRFVME